MSQEKSTTRCRRSPSLRRSNSSASAHVSSRTRRSPSSAAGSTSCRSPSSSPPLARACSLPPRSSTDSVTASTCSRAAATPTHASKPCARRSAGRTTCSQRTMRQLFARLAVFAGGCTLDAAEDVCDADLDLLQSLVDKSLLRHTGGRFWMLETIREFARERLQQLADRRDPRATRAALLAACPESSRRVARSSRRGVAETPRRRSREPPQGDRLGPRPRPTYGGRAGWGDLVLPLRARALSRGAELPRAYAETARSTSLDQAELLYGAGSVAFEMGDYATFKSGTSDCSSSDAPAETIAQSRSRWPFSRMWPSRQATRNGLARS